jgi:hypothetical protein
VQLQELTLSDVEQHQALVISHEKVRQIPEMEVRYGRYFIVAAFTLRIPDLMLNLLFLPRKQVNILLLSYAHRKFSLHVLTESHHHFVFEVDLILFAYFKWRWRPFRTCGGLVRSCLFFGILVSENVNES